MQDPRSGLILIDKPSGLTSHDVVAQVRRWLRPALPRGTGGPRIGHTGTLDPLASGLLVLCLGSATRLSEYLVGADKRYRAVVRFGQTTDTYDAEGQVTGRSEVNLRAVDIQPALSGFRGRIRQTPPAYSAVKRGGRKAYELARRGEAVILEAREIEVFDIRLIDWQLPDATIDVHCSSGTYIRALAHDLGAALGCGAHLAALTRTASGTFSRGEAVSLADLKAAFDAGTWPQHVRPPEAAIADWPELHLTADEADLITHGRAVPAPPDVRGRARAHGPDGRLLAVGEVDAISGEFRPHKVFSRQTEAPSN